MLVDASQAASCLLAACPAVLASQPCTRGLIILISYLQVCGPCLRGEKVICLAITEVRCCVSLLDASQPVRCGPYHLEAPCIVWLCCDPFVVFRCAAVRRFGRGQPADHGAQDSRRQTLHWSASVAFRSTGFPTRSRGVRFAGSRCLVPCPDSSGLWRGVAVNGEKKWITNGVGADFFTSVTCTHSWLGPLA